MDSSVPLIIGSALILLFYALDMLAGRWRIPSVLFLIASGMATKPIVLSLGVDLPPLHPIVPVLGLLGLALVVLEGSLELRIRREQVGTIARSSASAILGIALFVVLVGLVLKGIDQSGWRIAFLNAVPLAVISSAIAIPSASRLPPGEKEFVSYESSLSDILGVLLFNALVIPMPLGIGTIFRMLGTGVLTLGLSLVVCGLLLIVLAKTPHKVRFFPLLAGLILSYSLGKHFHLSSLLLLLCFGLLFANLDTLSPKPLRSVLVPARFQQDFHLLETLVRETTFLARTFFFFVFGYSLNLAELGADYAWLSGLSLLAAIYLTRGATLYATMRRIPKRLLFLAPRGLVSVLLFGGIAMSDRSNWIGQGALLYVVLGSSLLQIFAGEVVAEPACVQVPGLSHRAGNGDETSNGRSIR